MVWFSVQLHDSKGRVLKPLAWPRHVDATLRFNFTTRKGEY